MVKLLKKSKISLTKLVQEKEADPDLLYWGSLHIMAVTLQVGSFAHPQEKQGQTVHMLQLFWIYIPF